MTGLLSESHSELHVDLHVELLPGWRPLPVTPSGVAPPIPHATAT